MLSNCPALISRPARPGRIIREIFSDPNCSRGEAVGLHCVVFLDSTTYREAEEQCLAANMKLWPGPDQDLSEVDIIIYNSLSF